MYRLLAFLIILIGAMQGASSYGQDWVSPFDHESARSPAVTSAFAKWSPMFGEGAGSRDEQAASLDLLADEFARSNEPVDWLRLAAHRGQNADAGGGAGGGGAAGGGAGGGGAGGGGAGAAEAVNPSVPLSQLQFQNVFVPESYGGSGYSNQFILQPVIAIDRKPDAYFPYHIARATLPILAPTPDPDGPLPGLGRLGDTTFFDLYFHPFKKNKKVSYGIGPVIVFPTATIPTGIFGRRQPGLGEWQLGPAFAYINAAREKWVYGFLLEAPFSLESDAYSVSVQPVFTRLLEDNWWVGIGDLLWKFDDQDGNYNLPLSIQIGKVVKAGKQPIKIFVAPDWTPKGLTTEPTAKYGVKLSVSFLLPGAEFGYSKEKAAKRCGRGCRHCR